MPRKSRAELRNSADRMPDYLDDVQQTLLEFLGDALIPDEATCRLFSVTRQSVYRWARDPDMDFPPAIRIAGRNYRRAGDLRRFQLAHFTG
jgi:hypothetical protein